MRSLLLLLLVLLSVAVWAGPASFVVGTVNGSGPGQLTITSNPDGTYLVTMTDAGWDSAKSAPIKGVHSILLDKGQFESLVENYTRAKHVAMAFGGDETEIIWRSAANARTSLVLRAWRLLNTKERVLTLDIEVDGTELAGYQLFIAFDDKRPPKKVAHMTETKRKFELLLSKALKARKV